MNLSRLLFITSLIYSINPYLNAAEHSSPSQEFANAFRSRAMITPTHQEIRKNIEALLPESLITIIGHYLCIAPLFIEPGSLPYGERTPEKQDIARLMAKYTTFWPCIPKDNGHITTCYCIPSGRLQCKLIGYTSDTAASSSDSGLTCSIAIPDICTPTPYITKADEKTNIGTLYTPTPYRTALYHHHPCKPLQSKTITHNLGAFAHTPLIIAHTIERGRRILVTACDNQDEIDSYTVGTVLQNNPIPPLGS